ncbi:MAG: LysR family transcriptional regulator [Tardiphaga sp.]|jgi:DNA-binding transcriptional LysR family regulator|nr:LysR family transcriptional regulator [Tardiphaga sp.]
MARLDINRSGEMEVFARVVELGGFSAAARAFRMTPSAVSKLVARLEARLGVRLISRSTRKLQLTPEGTAYYDRSIRILDDINTAEHEAAIGATPRGRVRVNTSVPFGLHWLLPLLPGFLKLHPGVSIDVSLTDTVVDLLEERADIAIRVGPLRESRLLARKLGESRTVVVAAPAYLAEHGTPRTPADLGKHNMLGFCFSRQVEGWRFRDVKGGIVTVPPAGNALVSDGEAMQRLAVAGAGLARLARFHVDHDIEAGRLVPVLEDFNPGDLEAIHAVFLGHGGQLPARVRAFLDYLVEHVRL